MAGTEVILQELKSFCKENNEHVEAIRQDILKINIRLEEAVERIEEKQRKNPKNRGGDG